MSSEFGGETAATVVDEKDRSLPIQCPAESIAQLIASLVVVDGVRDPNELAIAHRACEKFGVAAADFRAALDRASADPSLYFRSALEQIDDPVQREELTSILFEIASADELLDRREAELLRAIKDVWGVSVSFLDRPIEWDEDQQLVIEAPCSDRLLVSAGPGMGKTSVACSRVSYLIEKEDVADSNIWLVSFTRTAIAEVKGRIAAFAEDPDNVFAVKISTIDSQAWKVRYGFSPEEAEKLFGGFDTGIVAATELMDERAEDIRDTFGGLEHLIVDEAQDITGDRARFLLKFIELLPPECGLTVFHDPAQAIYDYGEEGEPFRFTDGLKETLGAKLQEFSLKRIYRTQDPALLKLYEDLRLDILGNADVSTDDFKARAELIKRAASSAGGKQFDQTDLAGYDEALVLFRRKIEVAQASSFMAHAERPHRLRMSGLPRYLQPWLALTLGKTDGKSVGREEFLELHLTATSLHQALMGGSGAAAMADDRWVQLRRYGRSDGDRIDLIKLRSRLAGSAPDEFVLPEFGHNGPILGTIHASKGREADHVFLQINDGWGSGERENQDLAEESRVLFVGATRAKKSLAVQGGYALPYATSTESGRCYRWVPKRRNGAQVQIGMADDLDPFSVAKLVMPIDELASTPTPFPCLATLEKGAWIYRFMTLKGRLIGSTTPKLSSDLMEIVRSKSGRGYRSPDRIDHIYVFGFAAAVAAPGDERIAGAKGTAAVSGFWIIPQIAGLPTVFFP
ncbi:MAG: UvrD-helicase domain-containing protein [Sphingomicrobium sp.]